MLHALSDPARLSIVRHLAAKGECSCGVFDLPISKPTLSHHLRVLREGGVVRTRPDGRKRIVSLRREDLDARFPGLVGAVLDSEPPANGTAPARPPIPATHDLSGVSHSHAGRVAP